MHIAAQLTCIMQLYLSLLLSWQLRSFSCLVLGGWAGVWVHKALPCEQCMWFFWSRVELDFRLVADQVGHNIWITMWGAKHASRVHRICLLTKNPPFPAGVCNVIFNTSSCMACMSISFIRKAKEVQAYGHFDCSTAKSMVTHESDRMFLIWDRICVRRTCHLWHVEVALCSASLALKYDIVNCTLKGLCCGKHFWEAKKLDVVCKQSCIMCRSLT